MFQTRSGAGFFLDLHGGAVALRKMIQDMASLKHSSILYLVYFYNSVTFQHFLWIFLYKFTKIGSPFLLHLMQRSAV